MGKVIQVPNEGFVRKALIEAEDTLLAKTGRRFSLMLDRADDTVLDISARRDDGAVASVTTSVPRRFWLTTAPRDHVHAFIQGKIDEFVGTLALGNVEDEPEAAAPPETEQRFAVVLAFGSRPDVVLTPEHGVPADEAVRIFRHFVTAAATIGGRPAMLPLGAA